jgi:hypothetical protein
VLTALVYGWFQAMILIHQMHDSCHRYVAYLKCVIICINFIIIEPHSLSYPIVRWAILLRGGSSLADYLKSGLLVCILYFIFNFLFDSPPLFGFIGPFFYFIHSFRRRVDGGVAQSARGRASRIHEHYGRRSGSASLGQRRPTQDCEAPGLAALLPLSAHLYAATLWIPHSEGMKMLLDLDLVLVLGIWYWNCLVSVSVSGLDLDFDLVLVWFVFSFGFGFGFWFWFW